MRLSKREKTLIIALLVFAALALFISYALIPKLNEVTALRQEVSDVQFELTQKQMEYESQQDTKARLTESQQEAERLYGTLQGDREYDISLLISDILVEHGLTPVQFNIDARIPSTLLGEEQAGGYAFCREISLVFSGSRANANRFMDYLSDYEDRFVPHVISMSGGESQTYNMQITLYEFAK